MLSGQSLKQTFQDPQINGDTTRILGDNFEEFNRLREQVSQFLLVDKLPEHFVTVGSS